MKKQNLLTVILFLTVLFAFSAAFILLPDNSFSEEENRSLRTLPRFTAERLANGKFGEEINDYFADQFPMRDRLVGIKGIAEIGLGKGENDGILLGKNGQLARRLFSVVRENGEVTAVKTDIFDPTHVKRSGEGIDRAAQSLSVPFDVMITGRTLDVAASAFDYPDDFSQSLFFTLYANVGEHVNVVDTAPVLREMYDNGERVYYRTDHHWTTLGAYHAYAQLMRSWGLEEQIIPITAFDRQTVSEDFYGTAWSASGMKFISPDTLEIWYLGNEDDFSVVADGKELSSIYSMGYLEKKDQYSVFLDGTHDVVTITKKDGQTRPTLLLLKDSFANSLAPFLAQHFDLVLCNLSSAKTDFTDVTALAEQYAADRVLLVYTVENVVTDDKLTRLR